jgi:hypothetical protein
MVESLNQGNLVLTFEGVGGAPLLSAVGSAATACGGGVCYSNTSDLNLLFRVTAPAGMTMSTALLSLTGSATLNGYPDSLTADLANIAASESSSSYNPVNLDTDYSKNPNQVTTEFAPGVNSFSVDKDLNVTGWGVTPGVILQLNTVTQVFTATATPEPISISLLAVGVGGLAAARRRRRR